MVELAVVVVVLALLLGSILVPLHTQVEARQVADAQKMLEDIKEALVGHAIAKGYLPCPDRTSGGTGPPTDAANDGLEDYDAATGTCRNISGVPPRVVGNVPWVTLGLGASDPWGNRFRYALTPAYGQRPPAAPFGLATAAVLVVCTSAACTQTLTPASPDGAVAVIVSHGKNGYGAIDALTGSSRPAPQNADEADNLGGTSYTSRPIFSSGNPLTEFDDIVAWLGKYTLFQRMVAAGRLP